MPFTFSHPAIVLPLRQSKKIPLSFTGLIAGSMAPDFEFLLRLRNTENFGHTWIGVIVCDIPFAVVLSFMYHYLVRDTFTRYLPTYFRLRFIPFMKFDWCLYFKKHTLNFLIAVLTGILSHFLLDSFTHENKMIAQWLPLFAATVVVCKQSIPVYLLLQIFTSIAGAVYILWFISAMEKGAELAPTKNIAGYWILLVIVAIVIFVLRLQLDKVHQSNADIIIAATGSVVYAFLVVTMIKKIPR